MKTPLRYQITEFDCGSVSLLNCITYLFDREKIPAELVKEISTYTLDCYDEQGNLGQKGTSRAAVNFISRWLCDYAAKKNFGLKCRYLSGEKVTLRRIVACLKAGGVVNLRTYQDIEHYVTITGVDKNYFYIWDPYFMEIDEYKDNNHIEVVLDRPKEYNRKVEKNYVDSTSKHDFALGPVGKREVVLMEKTK